MKNTGTLPIAQVTFNWEGLAGPLADHLFVTKLYNSRTNVDEIADYIAVYDVNHDGKMSLTELGARAVDDEYWVGGNPVFLPLDAPVQFVEYTFQFDPAAGNELQGLNFNYTLNIMGFQVPKY